MRMPARTRPIRSAKESSRGTSLICSKHLWEFEIRTGKHISRLDRPETSLNRFPVRIVEGAIEVDLAAPSNPRPLSGPCSLTGLLMQLNSKHPRGDRSTSRCILTVRRGVRRCKPWTSVRMGATSRWRARRAQSADEASDERAADCAERWPDSGGSAQDPRDRHGFLRAGREFSRRARRALRRAQPHPACGVPAGGRGCLHGGGPRQAHRAGPGSSSSPAGPAP